jgi:hypothetical protein
MTKTKTTIKTAKLSLHRETLRGLSGEDLGKVGGGVMSSAATPSWCQACTYVSAARKCV